MIGRVISAILTIVLAAITIITVTTHAVPVFAQTLIQPPRIEFCDLTKKSGSRCIKGEKIYASLSKEEAEFVRTKLLKIRPNSSKEEISALLKAEIIRVGRTNYFMHKGKQVGLSSIDWVETKNSGQDILWRIKNDGQVSLDYVDGSIFKVTWIKQMGSRFVVVTLLNW